MRTAEIKRKTKETDIELRLTLEGGERRIDTGIGFFDHMLNSFAVHSGFGLELTCKGDLEVDGHHSVEDCGIALGQALSLCLGDKAGIARFGQAFVPMDEALCRLMGRNACLKSQISDILLYPGISIGYLVIIVFCPFLYLS